MQVVKIREYKTAGDMLINKEMSEAHREMANSLLDSIYGQVLRGVAVQREMSEEAVRAAFDRGPAGADELIAAGLVDGVKFLDEIEDELAEDDEVLSADDYAVRRELPEAQTAGRVAIVYGVGPIYTGGGGEGMLDDEQGMASDTIGDAFAEIAEDDDIDAVVFRVDSPGGSALASDLIWRATQRAKEAKPVIVSMSDVAGSGGYYVAAGASRIVALPGTLTGSIGVVLSKPNISGLLAKLGVNAQTLQRGDNAALVSMTDSLSGAQLERLKANMDSVYRLFVSRVADGRAMDAGAVDEVGRGRVWTGEQAVENGLVDQLGGLLSAINAAKEAAGIDPQSRVEIVTYPREKDVFERISKAFGTRAATYMPALWKRVRATLAAYEFPSGSILTLMPAEIAIR
jgi:protease-4